MVVEQFPLLLEVANVVPEDLDLNLCLEGEDIYGDCYMNDDYTNEYMKGRLSVQALLSEPELHNCGITQNQGPFLLLTFALKHWHFHIVLRNVTNKIF